MQLILGQEPIRVRLARSAPYLAHDAKANGQPTCVELPILQLELWYFSEWN
jgi:hypothetical protein